VAEALKDLKSECKGGDQKAEQSLPERETVAATSMTEESDNYIRHDSCFSKTGMVMARLKPRAGGCAGHRSDQDKTVGCQLSLTPACNLLHREVLNESGMAGRRSCSRPSLPRGTAASITQARCLEPPIVMEKRLVELPW
jgi:hypothetical protein